MVFVRIGVYDIFHAWCSYEFLIRCIYISDDFHTIELIDRALLQMELEVTSTLSVGGVCPFGIRNLSLLMYDATLLASYIINHYLGPTLESHSFQV